MEECLNLNADQVYADHGLLYHQATIGDAGPQCESEFNLWQGPKNKAQMFKPICIKHGVCESWEYKVNDNGECIQVESSQQAKYDCVDYGSFQRKRSHQVESRWNQAQTAREEDERVQQVAEIGIDSGKVT